MNARLVEPSHERDYCEAVGTVLLVEDSIADAELFKLAVRESVMIDEVVHLTTGPDAFAYLLDDNHPQPNATAIDLHLPGAMSGFDLLRAIRGRKELTGHPVIVISGSSDAEADEVFDLTSADAYINKSTGMSGVRSAVGMIEAIWLDQQLKD